MPDFLVPGKCRSHSVVVLTLLSNNTEPSGNTLASAWVRRHGLSLQPHCLPASLPTLEISSAASKTDLLVVWFSNKRCLAVDRQVAQALPVMSHCEPTHHTLLISPTGFCGKLSVFARTRHCEHCLLHRSIIIWMSSCVLVPHNVRFQHECGLCLFYLFDQSGHH